MISLSFQGLNNYDFVDYKTLMSTNLQFMIYLLQGHICMIHIESSNNCGMDRDLI